MQYLQYGIAGAVLVVVLMFLKYLTRQEECNREEREKVVQRFAEVVENHMNESSKAMSQAAQKVGESIARFESETAVCRRGRQ
jgi:hypothetical protein